AAALLLVLTACRSAPKAAPDAAPQIAAAAPEAGPPGAIGNDGGVLAAEGARLTVPAGALKDERTFRIERLTGADLADWPRGTSVGFTFEPAEERFRIPATIELPHAEGDGEVVCQSGGFARTVLDFDAMPSSKPFPLHVSELPRRCAVYSSEHVKA